MIFWRLIGSVFILAFGCLPTGAVAWIGYAYLNDRLNYQIFSWLLDDELGVACYVGFYLIIQAVFALAAAGM